jgi:hypothetical protein
MPVRCTQWAAGASGPRGATRWLVPTLYIIFLMVPIYWLFNMSVQVEHGEVIERLHPLPG